MTRPASNTVNLGSFFFFFFAFQEHTEFVQLFQFCAWRRKKSLDPWGWKIFMRKQCDRLFFFLLRVRPKFGTVKEQFRRLVNSYLLHLFSSFYVQGYSNTRSAGNFCWGKILLRLYGRLGERRMFFQFITFGTDLIKWSITIEYKSILRSPS